MLSLTNKYAYLFILAVGFVLGIYFSSLFSGCGHPARTIPPIAIIKPEVLQKQVAAAQAVYQVKIDSLGAAAKDLQADLQNTKGALDKAKHKNLVLQTQVYDLLDRTATNLTDTVTRIRDCDSLQGTVKDLVVSGQAKDSLYEEVTSNLQTQVSNKDSTIQAQAEENQSIKASFTQSIQQQQALHVENKALRKSIRHQKVTSTLKTIGLVLISALAGHYLTHP